MSKGNSSEDRARAPLDDQSKTEGALARCASNLWHYLKEPSNGERFAVSISRRGPRDWVAVARRNDPSLGAVVAFGNSESAVGALCKLSASIGGDKWLPDKYADQRGANGPSRLPGL